MMWTEPELKWMESNRTYIDTGDLEKLFLGLGRANLEGFKKSRLTCGLAFILNLPIRIFTLSDKAIRVCIVFGNSVRAVTEFNVSDSKNLSLIVVKLNKVLKDTYTLPDKVIEYLLDRAWDAEVR